MGHDFEAHPEWTSWNAASREFHANLILAHAFETAGAPPVRVRWRLGSAHYAGDRAPEKAVTAAALVGGFFLTTGDAYLADPSRPWTSMESDDLITLFLRIQRVHGWGPFRSMYRTMARLASEKRVPPTEALDIIALLCAILSKSAGTDLTGPFRLWRIPITEDSVREIGVRYGL